MRIRIIRESPGCVFPIGQLLKMGDKQAQHLIDNGFAEPVDDIEFTQLPAIPVMSNHNPRGGNPFQLPPRWIHKCGYVAKDEAQLAIHAETCR